MSIPMKDCIEMNGGNPFRGVVQIGSHLGRDAQEYDDSGVRNVLWIDANQDTHGHLYENTRGKHFHSIYFQAYLTDEDRQELEFKVMEKEGCSSLLEAVDSSLIVRERRLAISKRFETLVRENIVAIDMDLYDFVMLDCQGTELQALKGFGPLFDRFPIKAVCSKVWFDEVYKGGCTYEELDTHLTSLGFDQKLLLEDGSEGYAFYLRELP